MKKVATMFLLAVVMFFSLNLSSARAEEQKMSFHLAPGQVVQRYVSFVFTVPADNFEVYRLETGSPFFNKEGYWRKIVSGQLTRIGIYRFVPGENGADINIRGEGIYLSAYQTHMDEKDISLLINEAWDVFDIALPPRNEAETGRYMFSYFTAHPGWGISLNLPVIDREADFSGKLVAVIVFDGAGFPQRIFPIGSPKLKNMWLNPGELAIMIRYEGKNWTTDRKIFWEGIKTANEILKDLAEE